MNKKIPFLTRQIVYSFLIGLLIGGIGIAIFDATAKKPLFSEAFMDASFGGIPQDCDTFTTDVVNCWRQSIYETGGHNWYSGGGSPTMTHVNPSAPATTSTSHTQTGSQNEQSPTPPPTPDNTVGAGDTCVFRHGIWICYN